MLLGAIGLCGCASFWLLYPGVAASSDPHIDPRSAGHPYQVITVTNPQGSSLNGWMFSSVSDCGTLMVAGGNAQNLSSIYVVSRYLIGHGFRVLVMSYQGFGENGGHADVNSLLGDAHAFYRYVQGRFPGQPIAFAGYSTGAVTGVCAGDSDPMSAIVAEGLFNPKSIVEDKHIWIAIPLEPLYKPWVPAELDTSRCLEALHDVPVLFLHSPRDSLAPYEAARRLFEGYSGPKQFIETNPAAGADAHFGSASDPNAQDQVLSFIKQHLQCAPHSGWAGRD